MWNFPYVAIEEALVNAVYHRSYEEREPIEVRIGYDELVVLSFPGPDRSIKTRDFEAMSFIASFAVSAMVDTKNQFWLNKLWDYIVGFNLDQYDYYDNTIKMISMIILSGNYWVPFPVAN